MHRREFLQTLGVAAGGSMLSRIPTLSTKLDRIGLELYAVRHTMAENPERTLAAIRAIGYTDVELLWSFDNFKRTPQQVRATLDQEGLRAPSCHMAPDTLLVGWERSLDIANQLGQQYLIVPSFPTWTSRTIADWLEWADHFNRAGAVARRHGLWLAFHNEAEHMTPIGGRIPYDAFLERLDPSVVRLQLDTGNMLIGGGDPMAYLTKYRDRYWSFHLKDVTPDRKSDTRLGQGIFDFKRFLAAVPNVNDKPCFVEDENASDELAAARSNFAYLRALEF